MAKLSEREQQNKKAHIELCYRVEVWDGDKTSGGYHGITGAILLDYVNKHNPKKIARLMKKYKNAKTNEEKEQVEEDFNLLQVKETYALLHTPKDEMTYEDKLMAEMQELDLRLGAIPIPDCYKQDTSNVCVYRGQFFKEEALELCRDLNEVIIQLKDDVQLMVKTFRLNFDNDEVLYVDDYQAVITPKLYAKYLHPLEDIDLAYARLVEHKHGEELINL